MRSWTSQGARGSLRSWSRVTMGRSKDRSGRGPTSAGSTRRTSAPASGSIINRPSARTPVAVDGFCLYMTPDPMVAVVSSSTVMTDCPRGRGNDGPIARRLLLETDSWGQSCRPARLMKLVSLRTLPFVFDRGLPCPHLVAPPWAGFASVGGDRRNDHALWMLLGDILPGPRPTGVHSRSRRKWPERGAGSDLVKEITEYSEPVHQRLSDRRESGHAHHQEQHSRSFDERRAQGSSGQGSGRRFGRPPLSGGARVRQAATGAPSDPGLDDQEAGHNRSGTGDGRSVDQASSS